MDGSRKLKVGDRVVVDIPYATEDVYPGMGGVEFLSYDGVIMKLLGPSGRVLVRLDSGREEYIHRSCVKCLCVVL